MSSRVRCIDHTVSIKLGVDQRAMVKGDVDQWQILKTFPDYTWKALQERYAYNFGNGRWRTEYAGHKPYGRYTRWRGTAEYKAEQQPASQEVSAPQPSLSYASTDEVPLPAHKMALFDHEG